MAFLKLEVSSTLVWESEQTKRCPLIKLDADKNILVSGIVKYLGLKYWENKSVDDGARSLFISKLGIHTLNSEQGALYCTVSWDQTHHQLKHF